MNQGTNLGTQPEEIKIKSPTKKRRIIGLAITSIVVAIVVMVIRTLSRDQLGGEMMPAYGVPMMSVYALEARQGTLKKLFQNMYIKLTSFIFTGMSLVVGICVYAKQRWTRK